MNSDVLHPPKSLEPGIATFTLSLYLEIAFRRVVTHSATKKATCDPNQFFEECFYQLARLMEEEFRAVRPAVAASARSVAEALEDLSQPVESDDPPPFHPIQQRLLHNFQSAPKPASTPSLPPLPEVLNPAGRSREGGQGKCRFSFTFALFRSKDKAGCRPTTAWDACFDPEALDEELFYQLARHLEKEYRAERTITIAALRSIADVLEARSTESLRLGAPEAA